MATSAWIQVKMSDWSEWQGESNGESADSFWKKWASEIKNWPGVKSIWSSTGQWDWLIQLEEGEPSNWQNAKNIMWKLKKHNWVSDTLTWWSEEF